MDMRRMEGLAQLADETDAEAPPTPEQQQAQAQEQAAAAAGEESARQWGAIVYMLGNAAAMLAPELRRIYTEEACFNWGRSMHPVAQKYGWDSPDSLPELGLLISTAGLVVPSYFAIKQRLAELPEEKDKAGWLGSLRDWWRGRGKKATPAPAAAAVTVATGGG